MNQFSGSSFSVPNDAFFKILRLFWYFGDSSLHFIYLFFSTRAYLHQFWTQYPFSHTFRSNFHPLQFFGNPDILNSFQITTIISNDRYLNFFSPPNLWRFLFLFIKEFDTFMVLLWFHGVFFNWFSFFFFTLKIHSFFKHISILLSLMQTGSNAIVLWIFLFLHLGFNAYVSGF